MTDRLDEFFAALAERLDTPRLGADEIDAVLDLARVTAHQEERRFAPLVSYLAGRSLGRGGGPTERAAELRTILKVVEGLALDDSTGG